MNILLRRQGIKHVLNCLTVCGHLGLKKKGAKIWTFGTAHKNITFGRDMVC